MSTESLEDAIQRAGSAVELLRNAAYPAYSFPVPPEHTNWRSEQRAWRETCALLDQSHHMADLFVSGRDALELFAALGVNSFAGFKPDMAKQFVAVNPEGYFIGDGILFYLDDEQFDLVGGHYWLTEWIRYKAQLGGYRVSIERDEDSTRRDGPPKLYRYELQGPAAVSIMERVTGKPVPEVKFFHMTRFAIAGRSVRALRHGMAAQPGFELFGPWEEGEAVRAALLAAGEEFGLRQAGAKAYSTANLESGWVPSPLPAIFTGEEMAAFRRNCPADRIGSLAGSLYSPDITDYYVTPYDLGYGRIVSFDHDYVGREALEEIGRSPRRTKVTLVWNEEDVLRAIGSQFGPGLPAKYIELPKARYGRFQVDKVLRDGDWVGISMDCGYIYNEKAMISLAAVDVAVSEPGTEVVVLWGEQPNSAKPQVEPHQQMEIRATVAPAPYVQFARERYRVGSLTASGGSS